MVVSAIDTRYKTGMNAIFDEENKLRKWLLVEVALANAHAKVGTIPEAAAERISKASPKVKLERVKEIEAEIHHDLMAVVKALAEQAGDAGGYVHLGATSYDIEDTATALIFGDALEITGKRLKGLGEVLLSLAREHKKEVCVGRTHGQHAVPTTYGMKFALWYDEVKRHEERLKEARERVLVGKMTGAVGTMASFGEKAFELQDAVMNELGLKAAGVTNQIIQRDRHAEVLFLLALIACTLEKIAKEIRNLQRDEIAEVAEPFTSRQVGSSTMPQKRNPHRSERICGLARVVRSNIAVALENIPLEHERDLTNSAAERCIWPESFIITDYMLKEAVEILEGLEFFPKNIRKNLKATGGLILTERVMVELTRRGMSRQDAHAILREAAIRAREENKPLIIILQKDERVTRFLKDKELMELLNEKTYIGKAVEIVDRLE